MNQLIETNTIFSFDNVKGDVRSICDYLNKSHRHLIRAINDIESLKQNQQLSNDVLKELINEVKRLKVILINLEPQVKVERKLEPIIVEKTIPKVVVKTKIVKRKAQKRKYVASRESTKIHDKRCAFARNINRRNKIVFESKLNAHAKGFKDCACVA